MFNTSIREKLLDKIENINEVECFSILVKLYERQYAKTRKAYKQEGCSRWNQYRNEYIKSRLLIETGREFTEEQIDRALNGIL